MELIDIPGAESLIKKLSVGLNLDLPKTNSTLQECKME
jgi:hypothetical protein